jgi:hypothetical protein
VIQRVGYKLEFDPCRLARQVKEIHQLDIGTTRFRDPCHLVWQVNEIGGYRATMASVRLGRLSKFIVILMSKFLRDRRRIVKNHSLHRDELGGGGGIIAFGCSAKSTHHRHEVGGVVRQPDIDRWTDQEDQRVRLRCGMSGRE